MKRKKINPRKKTLLVLNIAKTILAPIVFFYLVGLIVCFRWKSHVHEVHEEFKREGKNNIDFAKRMISDYCMYAFLGCMNIFFWILTTYLIWKKFETAISFLFLK
jgi:hypothetical protein